MCPPEVAQLGEAPQLHNGEQRHNWVHIPHPAIHRFDTATDVNECCRLGKLVRAALSGNGGAKRVASQDGDCESIVVSVETRVPALSAHAAFIGNRSDRLGGSPPCP